MRTSPPTESHFSLATCAVALLLFGSVGSAEEAPALAREILTAAGVKGGLFVHLGCGDGKLTAALGTNANTIVHGLDADADQVEAARKHVQALGLYGKVSVDRLSGERLPYVDNLVNLVVSEGLGDVPMAEVMRVLAPNGVACMRQGEQWKTIRKPRPPETDEWTHFLHDASNNAVSKDEVVGPPRRLQWVGSPRWTRHHDHMSSMSSLVTANGRLFYIFDEGSTASIVLPSHWSLVARDAFNGTILWKRSIPKWFTQLWPLKSGPALLTRRLVAVGDEVYVTLGMDAAVTALDAATGETVRTYRGSEATDEIIVSEGAIFLAVNKDHGRRWGGSRANTGAIRAQVRSPRWHSADSKILAFEAKTGEALWERDSNLAASTLAADAKHVYFHDGQKVLALSRKSGEQAWASEPLPMWDSKLARSYFTPTLVVYGDVVLWSGGEKSIPHRGGQDAMTALDAATGKKLWSAPHAASGYQSAEDLLVAGGLVWTGATSNGGYDGVFRGYDPRTGELKREFPPDVDENTYWFHHRCYRGKATEKFLLMSRTGIEFIDINRKHWEIHHWVRGACLSGIVPANGLIYAPPHSCACYPETKLYGFSALAPASQSVDARRAGASDERLERGPAFGQVGEPQSAGSPADDWPTYRHDMARSGCTAMAVPADLKQAWERDLGGRLSSVVVVEGKLFVASVDTHTVHALDAATGEPAWSYTAGGRIDSPPTIWQGHCLFGSADGYAYCLRASDGVLAWRFRAAPTDQRHMVFEQVESVWPVHGNVMVQDGVAWLVAGRQVFVDGGLWLHRLDPKTGRVLSTTRMDDKDPESGKNLQVRHQVLQMPVGLSDILSSDGKRVYMRSQVFDLDGKRGPLGPNSGDLVLQATIQRGEEAHLFAPYGFVDGSWFHRSYWVYGRSFSGGHGGYYRAGKFTPSGRILAVSDENVYGYGRKPKYLRWTTALEYQLFASRKEPPELPEIAGRRQRRGATGSWIEVANTPSLDPTGKPVTVEAWVKAEKPNGVVLARGGPAHGYVLMLKKGVPCFGIRSDSKPFAVSAKQKAVGKWVHLAGVLTADKKLQIYVDGKLAGTAEAGGLIISDPAQTLQVGADAGRGEGILDYASPCALTGAIEEVRVYHGTLSAEEIEKHCATPGDASAADAELVLHFDFEKGEARDQSGSKNHGTLSQVKPAEGKRGNAMQFTGKGGGGGARGGHYVEYQWSVENPPLFARAIVLAGETLFVAGPPDRIDEDAVVKGLDLEDTQRVLAEQDSTLAGAEGALLLTVSAVDGTTRSQLQLTSPPVWDGMAAAGGRLYVATMDGKVRCMDAAR